MRTFSRTEKGVVVELFPPSEFPVELIPEDGDIRSLFHPALIWVEVTNLDPQPAVGWTYNAGVFSATAPYVPAPDEILTANKMHLESLQAAASQVMTPLLLSLQLGDATDAETAQAKLWQAYSRALKAVDLTIDSPLWPTAPA
jgi:hypothetical protein